MSREADNPQIYKLGSTPSTRVALSMKNRVFSRPYTTGSPREMQIGVLSTFDHSESRSVDPVRGVGMGDRVIELAPGLTEPMSLTLNKTLLYTAGIMQELGYRAGVDGLVRSLRHHKWPFDIRQELVFSELVTNRDQAAILQKVQETNGPNYALVTFFEACWLESISRSSQADTAVIMEDCSARATDVSDGRSQYGNSTESYGDLLDAGNNPILRPGSGSRLYNAA